MTSTTADAATGVPQDSNPTPAPKRITAAAPNASTPPEMPHGGLATDQPTWCRKELGHVMLHAPLDGVGAASTVGCRGRQEVEAESVAFLVASAHGMDTASYSFPYVAGWAAQDGDSVEATLRETAGRALTTAHQILDRLDRDNPAALPVAEDTAAVSWLVTPARLDGAAHQRRAAPLPSRTPDVGIRR